MAIVIDSRQGESPELCRAVTHAEIEDYQSNGWAKLEGLVSPIMIGRLLETVQEIMGKDGLRDIPSKDAGIAAFRYHHCDGMDDEMFRPMLKLLARNAKALMARGNDVEMRYFDNQFLTKLPSRHEDELPGAGATDFHQDFPDWNLDRAGGMVFWIALTDMQPEAGTMSFLNGSHRKGPLGSIRTFAGTETGLADVYPKLFDQCPPSPQVTYRAGDATVHGNLCVHGAGRNLTDRPRWAHAAIFNPADACWIGAPSRRFEKSIAAGLKPFQPLDDENFPIASN